MVTEMSFRLSSLEIRETDTSVVSYTRKDWVNNLGSRVRQLAAPIEVPAGAADKTYFN